MAIESELTFSISGNNKIYTGYCNDLSHTGINFNTEQIVSEGQSLEITVETKNSKFEPMLASVEVVRVDLIDNQYRVGCKILEFK